MVLSCRSCSSSCRSDCYVAPSRTYAAVRHYQFGQSHQLCHLVLQALYRCGVGSVVHSLLQVDCSLSVFVCSHFCSHCVYLAVEILCYLHDFLVGVLVALQIGDFCIFSIQRQQQVGIIACYRSVIAACAVVVAVITVVPAEDVAQVQSQ